MERKEEQERPLEKGEKDQLDAMLEYKKQKMRNREIGASQALDKLDEEDAVEALERLTLEFNNLEEEWKSNMYGKEQVSHGLRVSPTCSIESMEAQRRKGVQWPARRSREPKG